MAKKTSYYKLTQAQKNEVRRLTQLANRRIKAFTREFEKEGKEITPLQPTGGIQTRQQWHSEKTPISRSVKFTSEKAFKEHMRWLKSFEFQRENVSEFKQTEKIKLKRALYTAVGDIPPDLMNKIDKMTLPQISEFWNTFSEKARRMGAKYSSDEAMADTLNEVMDEDIDRLKQF